MGEDICCSESNKNNISVHVHKFIIRNINIILQLTYNSGNKRKKMSSFDIGKKSVRKINIVILTINYRVIPKIKNRKKQNLISVILMEMDQIKMKMIIIQKYQIKTIKSQ